MQRNFVKNLPLHAIPHQHTPQSSQNMLIMHPTIPNVLHKLQSLAHNTQHSSQIAKPCSYSTSNPNTRFTKRKICICYSTQYPTFITNGKSLVAIAHQYGILQKLQKPCCYSRATTPDILHKKPHCHSNNTQYCCYSTPSLQF